MATGQAIFSTAPSRAEHLAAELERTIRERHLADGARIGTFDDIQRSSGLSRPTVSEAIRLLKDRGTVHVRAGRTGGIFVVQPGPVGRLRQALAALPENGQSLLEAIELHDQLEMLIALGAARASSAEDATDLRVILDALASVDDRRAFLELTLSLHERIAAISPNRMAAAVYVATLANLRTGAASNLLDTLPDDFHHLRRDVHVELVEAIIAGDEDLVRAAVLAHAEPRWLEEASHDYQPRDF